MRRTYISPCTCWFTPNPSAIACVFPTPSHPLAQGTFSTVVHVPDVYGVFKFVINYKRKGLSVIHLEEQVPIRPYRHNEYERFILAAYPYYTSAFSMMVGFFVLGFFVLYSK